VRAALVMTGFRVALEDWLAGKHTDLEHGIDTTMRVMARVTRGWAAST